MAYIPEFYTICVSTPFSLFIIKSDIPILVFVLDFVYCQNFFGLFLTSLVISISLFFTAFRVRLFTLLRSLQYSLYLSPSRVYDIEYCSPLGKSDHSLINFNFNCYIQHENTERVKYYYDKADLAGIYI
jgi:hypothetical protein